MDVRGVDREGGRGGRTGDIADPEGGHGGWNGWVGERRVGGRMGYRSIVRY